MSDPAGMYAAMEAAQREEDALAALTLPRSLVPLLHALDAARGVILASLDNNPARAWLLLMEAHWAADDAYDPGTAEAESLALILADISVEAERWAA